MRIATWNVNSVRARLPRLLPWLEGHSHDVICLQELKCRDEDFPREPIEALGYQIAAYGQKSHNGVAILSRRPAEDVVRGFPGDDEDSDRRLVAATVDGVRVINVYVVNGQEVGSEKYAYKLSWLERLRDVVRDELTRHERLVLTGDFNITFDDRDVHDPDGWREKILCSTPEREALGRICDLGLIDTFREHHPEEGLYTWWDFRSFGFQRKQGLRIDFFLVSRPLLPAAASVEIDLDARRGDKPSDHAPVVLTLDMDADGRPDDSGESRPS